MGNKLEKGLDKKVESVPERNITVWYNSNNNVRNFKLF